VVIANNALGIGGMCYANNSMNPFLIKADLNGNSGCYDSVPNISIQLPFNYVVNNIILPTDTITLNVSNYNLIQTDFGMDSTVCLTTGYNINEGNLLKVKLFPNPFTNSTILEVDQFLNNATIELYNVTGFIVKKLKSIYGETVIIERANLSEGIYLAIIKENNLVTGRFKLIVIN
jgi:hypothetical protein